MPRNPVIQFMFMSDVVKGEFLEAHYPSHQTDPELRNQDKT